LLLGCTDGTNRKAKDNVIAKIRTCASQLKRLHTELPTARIVYGLKQVVDLAGDFTSLRRLFAKIRREIAALPPAGFSQTQRLE
jgi:hypothetical protein